MSGGGSEWEERGGGCLLTCLSIRSSSLPSGLSLFRPDVTSLLTFIGNSPITPNSLASIFALFFFSFPSSLSSTFTTFSPFELLLFSASVVAASGAVPFDGLLVVATVVVSAAVATVVVSAAVATVVVSAAVATVAFAAATVVVVVLQ